MAIKGLGFDMMSAYNRIGINDRTDTPVVREAVKAEEKKPVSDNLQSDVSGVKINLNFDSIRRRPVAKLDDGLKDFSKREAFNPALDDVSMKSEMDKAISIMEKDSSLKQYQYFVGDSNIITDDEDGLVFVK